MNFSARERPTLAQRLERLPVGTLYVRLALARTALAYSQARIGRLNAMRDIEEISAEIKGRGYQVGA